MSNTDELPTSLSDDDFASFYESIHDFAPFHWQQRLAKQVCRGGWPDYIKLPTSSGKTSVIDIAIFALAYQACEANRPNGTMTAARRIFFVVDRRIIVNEAYLQSRTTAEKLWKAAAGIGDNPEILKRVALWLRRLTADTKAPPLDCRELRGGIYRDDAWVRSPLQPTVLASTVDQIGSRLLFRGYGVSDRNLSIHAALTAHDSLIILDEAHCSKPFSQTLDSIARYRGEQWAKQPIDLPFSFVQMTATPPANLSGRELFQLDNELDYQLDPLLKDRHHCAKPVTLIEAAGAKGKSLHEKLAKQLVEYAYSLGADHGCKRIAIVVNRVAVARAAFEQLKDKLKKNKQSIDDASLMIGRMRPLDRDALTKSLREAFRSGADEVFKSPRFVVATQCLEVGADLDFDGMVCQCASLDALRQRFGRLNRLGNSERARGVILAAEGDLQEEAKLKEDKPLDPIYGNALARTWHWLNQNADAMIDEDVDERADGEAETRIPIEIDFGIVAMDAKVVSLSSEEQQRLSGTALDAPVLMPAHVDMLCQTSPRPTPEPEVAAYLHGPDRGMPEVRICWRADLDLNGFDTKHPTSTLNTLNWINAVSSCPPSSAECLSVPLPVVRKWLSGESFVDQTSDVLGETPENETSSKKPGKPVLGRCALIWRGLKRAAITDKKEGKVRDTSILVDKASVSRIRPNDTLVVPVEIGGWNQLGYLPDAPDEPNLGDWVSSTDSTKSDGTDSDQDSSPQTLSSVDIADRAFSETRARTILRVHPKLKPNAGAASPLFSELLTKIKQPDDPLNITFWKNELEHCIGDSQAESWAARRLERLRELPGKLTRYPGGIVWQTGLHTDRGGGMPPLPLDSFGDDDDALSQTGRVKLVQHLADVHDEVDRLTKGVGLSAEVAAVELLAAKHHDIGKADPRFQAMLMRKPVSVAYMQPHLWAKSDFPVGNFASELPRGFRHEMLSADLLARFAMDGIEDRDLLWHLVASHHGHARPLAPIAQDDALPGFRLDELNAQAVSHDERREWIPPWRLDSGIAERFWNLNRHYGWWGLAWLETTLRLADWNASATPGRGDVSKLQFPAATPKPSSPQPRPLLLVGIDGSKPLGYLAALGVFRTLGNLPDGSCLRFAWKQTEGAWRPVIFASESSPLSEEWLLDILMSALQTDAAEFPPLRIARVEDDNQRRGLERRGLFDSFAESADFGDRLDADWLSCNSSDFRSSDANSQLQTTRRDYHAIGIRGLLTECTKDHLYRSLFQPWDYTDPIAGVTLHLEPREDRRHAYQWHTPSGDPTRKLHGGMIGANRLALEAWPLFQSLPATNDNEKLVTIGFQGLKANNTKLTWPIWTAPIPLRVISTVLSLRPLHESKLADDRLAPLGISRVFRCSRILVGKTPNLTTASPVLA
jgi:CRISPR-associated endonuclease/helicase Cas3